MIEQLNESLKRLWQRIMMSTAQCIINTVIDSGGIQIVQLGLGGGAVKDNTPRMQEYGFTSNPPPGTFAIALFVGGDTSNGVVVATDNIGVRPTGLAPGEAKMYDNLGKYFYLSAAGIVIEANGMPVTVNNATHVTINASDKVTMETPLLRVSGDIIDNYHTNLNGMSQMRTIYNSHTHGGVQAGASNTNVPNQLE